MIFQYDDAASQPPYIYIYIYMNWKHMTRSLALTPFNPFQTKSTDWPLIN